jgi:RNase P subunit RPR2
MDIWLEIYIAVISTILLLASAGAIPWALKIERRLTRLESQIEHFTRIDIPAEIRRQICGRLSSGDVSSPD